MCIFLSGAPSTGQAGWGIAWYINDSLIPELVVQRGQTYTFVVYGGDDSTNLAQYHPFYITNSPSGGIARNTGKVCVYDSIEVDYACIHIRIYMYV